MNDEAPIHARDIVDAAERVRRIAHQTPVLTSRIFDESSRLQAFFKCENFQRGGSFKIRGATNFINSLAADQLRRGVVAYSSGNHAQAVAIAAESAGVAARLVMPHDAPRSKVEATRAHNGIVISYDRFLESREEIGTRIAGETGAVLVPPFDHPWIIAGQGTTALEFLKQVPDLEALVVPVGGGGLIAGCSIAAKEINPRIRIFGAEPEMANDTFQSFEAGERKEIAIPDTVADGLRATKPGAFTFPVVQRYVERILVVTEDEIKATVKFLLSRLKILVEPSGAVPAAAVLHHKLPTDIRRTGIILSGGNLDLDTLATF